jgi:hypothetical protein
MLIAAAVCPHPPLLIPQTTGVPDPNDTSPPTPRDAELQGLRAACHQAVSALLAERPDLIAVAGADPRTGRTAEYPPGAPGHLHDFGIPFTTGQAQPDPPDSPDPPPLPLSLTVGKWLLSGAASDCAPPAAVWWGIAPAAPPAECWRLGERLAALAPRVALLAMGDGPGRRARAAQDAADPEADRYDDQVAGALATADPAALAALDPGQDGPLVIAGRAAWQVLAGAAAGAAFGAELHYRGTPFEVSYFVASWHRAHW